MKPAVCIPRSIPGSNESRDTVAQFVLDWYENEVGYPVFSSVGDGPGEGRAQTALEVPPDFDVLVFADADTLAHPGAIDAAAEKAVADNCMVIAGDSHMYCSKESSERMMEAPDWWFPRPQDFTERSVYEKPCSGVFAVSRSLYEACGGYPRLGPWGFEDLCWFQLTGIVGDSTPKWVDGHITMHLWHEPSPRHTQKHPETERNRKLWLALDRARRGPDPLESARALFEPVGHTIP